MSPNKVSAKTVFLIAIAAVVFIVALFYVIQNSQRSRAALGANGVTITMTPASGTVAPNTDQVITVKLQPVTPTFMLSGFDLTFNATGNLQIVSASKPAPFSDEIFHNVSATQLRMARTVGSSGTDQQIAEFTITVRGTGNGTGAITLDNTKAEVVGTLPQAAFQIDTVAIATTYTFGAGGNPTATTVPGNPTATTAPNPTATNVPNNPTATTAPGNPTATTVPGGGGNATLNLKLKFQGIPKKPANASAETVKVSLRAENSATAINGTGSFTPDENGIYTGTVSLNAAAGSNYTLYVKGPRHLQKKVCVNSPTETSVGTYRCGRGQVNITAGANTIDLTKILLMTGDLPQQDGIVDAYDTSFIRQSFGSTDANKLSIGDLNRDNIVDTQDMSLIIQSLNVKYDEE